MTAIDLFAGCGGASTGLVRAGIRVIADYERDPDACATLAAAGLHPVQRDLGDLSGSELPAVGLWWASPPCQPDSTAGKRSGADDDRDGWPHLLRLLAEAESAGRGAAWLVCETVRGILPPQRIRTEAHQRRADRWLGILGDLRQHFRWVEPRLLDAADYGVPQHRKRVICVCGPHPIDWPEPTHSGQTLEEDKQQGLYWGQAFDGTDRVREPGSDGLLAHVTMREALALGRSGHVIGGGHNPNHPGDERRYKDLTDRPLTTIAAQHGGGAGNAGPFVQRPDWWHRSCDPDHPSRTIGTRANASINTSPVDEPAPTVSATEEKGAGARAWTPGYRTDGGTINRASCALALGTGRRRLTIEECLVLQDLAGHPVQGRTKASRYRQAGNAVPPRLAEVVARAIQAQLGPKELS